MAREIGIQGVSCFVADMKTAISGAQDIETLRRSFDEAARAG
jgi:predicted DsbA family dithiol-disulfide isomerase